MRWISTVGNYDYIFDWIFHENGTIGIDAGATGIEAVKGVKAKTMHDETAKDDTRYGTLIDHNIVGTTHQHIYNFRLDLDVDGENNSLVAMDPVVKPNTAGGPRTSTMQVNQYNIGNEQDAAQKFDPGTIRLLSNPNKEPHGQSGFLSNYSLCRWYSPGSKRCPVRAGRVDLSSFKLYGQAALGNALSSWRAFPGRQISEPFYS